MKTAIRALDYPKPQSKKLICTEVDVAVGPGGQYSSFRCTATYSHHRRSRFVIAGVGEGGWLCAGKTFAGCKLLRHGFVPTADVNTDGSIGAAADLASRGYLVDHDQFPYQPVHFCQQAGASTWSCPFTVNNAPRDGVALVQDGEGRLRAQRHHILTRGGSDYLARPTAALELTA